MAKSGFTKPIDHSALEKYVGSEKIRVGILDNAPDYPDGTSILMIANLTEYGGDGGTPPAYHWLKKSLRKDADYFNKKIKVILKQPAGTTRTSLLRALGRQAAERVADHVEKNDIGLQSNKPSTQKAKGGNSPMIDTQHMIQSIDSKVN